MAVTRIGAVVVLLSFAAGHLPVSPHPHGLLDSSSSENTSGGELAAAPDGQVGVLCQESRERSPQMLRRCRLAGSSLMIRIQRDSASLKSALLTSVFREDAKACFSHSALPRRMGGADSEPDDA